MADNGIKISQLATDAAPARTDYLTSLENGTLNVKALVSAYLALTQDTDLTFSDNTTGDVSATKHGFAPKGAKSVMQRVNTQTGTVSTTTTILPSDNTVPQNTEGAEFMSLAITPTNAANVLKIEVIVHGSPSVGQDVTAALFQDSTANALAAMAVFQGTNTGMVVIPLTYTMVAGTTSSTTFKVRAGMGGAGTFTFNGQAGAGKFGGVLVSSITITEYTT